MIEGKGKEGRKEVSFLFSYPFHALLLEPFFARCLTLVPRSLLRNRTKTVAMQATTILAPDLVSCLSSVHFIVSFCDCRF